MLHPYNAINLHLAGAIMLVRNKRKKKNAVQLHADIYAPE
jgi:hypothetical protein